MHFLGCGVCVVLMLGITGVHYIVSLVCGWLQQGIGESYGENSISAAAVTCLW